MTLDGFICGPNNEMDWIERAWTDDINQYVTDILTPVDTIVLGRKLAEGFIPYWASVAADTNNPEMMSGKKFTDTPKVVFTKTLNYTDTPVTAWQNTDLAKGDIVEEINKLKNQKGKDVYACGGVTFVSALVEHELIDDYYLFINPTAIGQGRGIFGRLKGYQNLSLVEAKAFDCGIVVMHYQLKSN